MQHQDNDNTQMASYFTKYSDLINTSPKVDNINEIGNKIQKLINQGSINIDANPADMLNTQNTGRSIKILSKEIESKKNQFNKDLLMLNMSLSRSSYLTKKKNSNGSQVKSMRVFNRRTHTDVSDQDLQSYNKRKLEYDLRLKQLKKQKKELMNKRQEIQQIKQKNRNQKQSKQKQLLKAREQQQKQIKLNKISERLKKLEESRVSRLDILRNSCVRSTNSIPKYRIMRYRFDCKEIQHQIKQREQLRSRQRETGRQYTHQSIMEHQNQYNRKLKTIRHYNTIQDQAQTMKKREAEFNLIKNPQKFNEKQEQNKLKAKLFEDKINQIRRVMTIDPQVGLQFQVAKDKSKHPFKYHYLKLKKNLSDIQIYENYSHFNFNSHPVELGNFYLDQVNKKNRNLVNKNGNSSSKRSKTDGSASEQKIKYKDYLQESRKKIKTQTKKEDQVQQLIKRYGSKSKVIEVLQQRAQVHTNNTIKKIEKLKKFDTYTNTLKLQKEVDDEFISSIKTKLQCFQVK